MAKLFLVVAGFITAHMCLQSFDAKTIDFGIVLMAATGGMAGWFIVDFFKKRA